MKNKFNAFAENAAHTIAKTFGNEHRYIKQDGSGFHSGKLKSIFEEADFTAGIAATAVAVGMTIVKQGNLDIASMPVMNCLLDSSFSFAIYYFLKITQPMPESLTQRHKRKAIDTTGTTLERAQLNIKDITLLNKRSDEDQMIGILSAILATAALTGSIFSSLPFTILFVAQSAMSARFLSKSYRANMLLKGHLGDPDVDGKGYVLCDKPPAKEVKVKKSISIFGGKTSLTP